MAKVLVVTSGKGGVGKTTSTAALGAALAQAGQNVVVVDFDVGLRNLDLVMGAERRVVYDLINVVQGDAKLAAGADPRQAARHAVPPAGLADARQGRAHRGGRRPGDGRAREKFDWVICDSPAGIERGATLAMRHADVAVVVTNPEVSSVRDSDRIIGLLDSKTIKAEKGERVDKHLLLTRYDPARAAARRDAQGRGRARDPLDPAARHHPGERGGAAGLEHRLAGDALERRERAGPRLSRRRPPAQGETLKMVVPNDKKRFFGKLFSAEGGMNVFSLFRRRGSAPVARERLQLLLAHERAIVGRSDLVSILREEILAVIAKHVTVDRDKIQVKMERGGSVSTLEVDIEIRTPSQAELALSA